MFIKFILFLLFEINIVTDIEKVPEEGNTTREYSTWLEVSPGKIHDNLKIILEKFN